MKENKKCVYCMYSKMVTFNSNAKLICNHQYMTGCAVLGRDGYCNHFKPYPDKVECGTISKVESPTEEDLKPVRDLGKILEFIKTNELKDVKFKYDQNKRIASIHGTKDGYSYSTMLKFDIENGGEE